MYSPSGIKVAIWPLTMAAAIALIGFSAHGALTLISQNASNISSARVSAPTYAERRTMAALPTPISPVAAKVEVPFLPTTVFPVTAPKVLQMVVTISSLAMRDRSTKSSAMIGAVAEGELVTVMDKKDSWLLVRTESGEVGWVFGKYLAPASALTAEVR